jgi:uncharacterized membrane protein YbaN (DUF454 family)
MKKYVYLTLGLTSLGFGAVGSFFPVLPTVPFLMLAAFCFARSSEKIHNWFVGTKLYRDNLADFVAGKGMTRRAKVRIMITVTALMSVGFVMMGMSGVVTGCVVLGCVWLLHILYFIFGIKTIPAKEAAAV